MTAVMRALWPGLRIMLLPLNPVLWLAGWLGILAAAGCCLMSAHFWSADQLGAALHSLLESWVSGSVAAGLIWLRRQLQA